MPFPTGFRCAALLTVLVLGWCTAPPVRADDDPPVSDDLRDRICLTIFNAVRGVTGADDVPDPDSMELYRERGEEVIGDTDGTAYAYRLQPGDASGERIVIDAQVVILREGHTPAAPEQWESIRVTEDDSRLGSTFYRERTSDEIRWAATYFELVRDGVQLRMRVVRPRPDDRTRDDLVRLATSQWEVFVAEAERNHLFDRARVFVSLASDAPADLQWRPWEKYLAYVQEFFRLSELPAAERTPLPVPDLSLDSGSVLHFLRDHGEVAVIPLEVHAEARDIEADRPYLINTNLSDDYGRPGISLTDEHGRPLPDSDGDGREDVTVPGGKSTARVLVRFKPFDLTMGADLRAHVLDQQGFVRFYYRAARGDGGARPGERGRDDAFSDLRVSRAGAWMPVVTRFELVGEDISNLDNGPRFAGSGSRLLRGPPAIARSYVTIRATAGSKWNAWTRLAEWAATRDGGINHPRPFGEDEAVPMGWRLVDDESTFVTTANARDATSLPGIPQHAKVGAVVEAEIVFSPPPRPGDIPAPDFGDGLAPDPQLDPGPLDLAQADAQFRQTLLLNQLRLTQRRVGPLEHPVEGISLPPDSDSSEHAAAVHFLARNMRLAVIKDPGRPEVVWKPESLTDADFRPPRMNHQWGPDQRFTAEAGIFELRLQMTISRVLDPRDQRTVDVAIRYNVHPIGPDARLHQREPRTH